MIYDTQSLPTILDHKDIIRKQCVQLWSLQSGGIWFKSPSERTAIWRDTMKVELVEGRGEWCEREGMALVEGTWAQWKASCCTSTKTSVLSLTYRWIKKRVQGAGTHRAKQSLFLSYAWRTVGNIKPVALQSYLVCPLWKFCVEEENWCKNHCTFSKIICEK